jgi:hypothetical protein
MRDLVPLAAGIAVMGAALWMLHHVVELGW